MKTVITYGTFDLLHNGHINLLKRAKALGDTLIVGITTDNYDRDRGKLNVQNDLMKRIEDVRKTGLADRIIIEEYFGQKIDDIQKYKIDLFAIGSDWLGHFDYLKEFCEVVYLDRTKGVSSTLLRNKKYKIINLGIIGGNGTTSRFIEESKYVSGIDVVGAFNPNDELSNLAQFVRNIDAVYIAKSAVPVGTSMRELIHIMLKNKKHVLFEEPVSLSSTELKGLFDYANGKSLVLLQAINTAYCPAFNHLMMLIKSKKIGKVIDIALSYTELSSYCLLPIIKLLGNHYQNISFYSTTHGTTDLHIRGVMEYTNAVATFKIGLGAISESNLIISGTDGYAYVPEPWWKTEAFELRFGNKNHNEKFFYKFLGEGLRYEILEFVKLIQSNSIFSNKLLPDETIAINTVIEKYKLGKGVHQEQIGLKLCTTAKSPKQPLLLP